MRMRPLLICMLVALILAGIASWALLVQLEIIAPSEPAQTNSGQEG